MRIPGYSYFVKEHLRPHLLKDCSVVIDGHNLFYQMYKNSQLTFMFGPECENYALYIRNQLEIFKKANLKCHIMFKGCHDSNECLGRHGDDFKIGNDYKRSIINPLLLKDTFMQVLQEMGFEYSIAFKTNIVPECVSLANKLSCPVISYNVKYSFLSAPYIPLEPGTKFELDENNFIKCGIFNRDHFLRKYKMSEEKLILFILISDQHEFDDGIFNDFLQAVRVPLSLKKRYRCLLRWLKSKSVDQATKEIFLYISELNQIKFSEKKLALHKTTFFPEDSIAVLYFTDRSKIGIDQLDPLWLEKGVCLNYVDLTYINLYLFGIYKCKNLIEDSESNKSILISADIIRYAYDLLTNFNDKEVSIHTGNVNKEQFSYKSSVSKPDFDTMNNVFENGWDHIKSLRLFEHFLIESFRSFNFGGLEKAPTDSRMLMIALVYFTRKKVDCVKSEVYSILLSYVLLSVVKEKCNNDINVIALTEQPLLDSTTVKSSVTAQDCDIAVTVMTDLMKISNDIFDRKILHPLIEFQHCLQQLNYLNTLCGSPFNRTIYSKTYNATFIYNILCEIKRSEKESFEYIIDLLNPAATVLAYFKGLLETYEIILYEYRE